MNSKGLMFTVLFTLGLIIEAVQSTKRPVTVYLGVVYTQVTFYRNSDSYTDVSRHASRDFSN